MNYLNTERNMMTLRRKYRWIQYRILYSSTNYDMDTYIHTKCYLKIFFFPRNYMILACWFFFPSKSSPRKVFKIIKWSDHFSPLILLLFSHFIAVWSENTFFIISTFWTLSRFFCLIFGQFIQLFFKEYSLKYIN